MRYLPREEEKKTKKIVINVSPADHKDLKIIASDQGISMTNFVIRALRHYLSEIMKRDDLLKN